MAMAMHSIPAGQLMSNNHSQYDLPTTQQTQIVQLPQPQRPQLHQTLSAPVVPTYSQTSVSAAPAQQVVQTRIVHVSSPRQPSNETTNPTRQYVCFKNSRHLNRDGHQWEHCEHITMSVSPDEIERSIRRHDIPENDLLTCLGNMGVYRQRHVKRYEDKLNTREPDPSAWMWVLEALGELKAKGRSTTPHTFWAIFTRTSRNNSTQQSRIVRPQQVLVHHEPVNVIEASPPLETASNALTISHPRTYTTTTTTAAAQPAQVSQPLLALPAPPINNQQSFMTSGAPSSTLMPANSYGGVSTPNYPVPGQWPAAGQNQATASRAAPQFVQQQAPQQTYSTQTSGMPSMSSSNAQGAWAASSSQPPVVHQGMPPRSQSSQQLALPAPQSRPSTSGRQMAPAPLQTTSTREYTRPLPGPISISNRNPVSVSPDRQRNSNVNVHQYQVRSHTPPRHRRDRWDDSLSDDSGSEYSGSSGRTSMTSESFYDLSPPKRRAPLSRTKDYHSVASTHTRSARKSHESSRSHHNHHQHHHHQQPVESSQPRTMPEAPRPQLARNSTFDVEIKTTSTMRRPAPIRRSVTDHPKTYRGYSDDEYDPNDLEERLNRVHVSPTSRGPPTTGFNHNHYEADGLVSYGSDRRAY